MSLMARKIDDLRKMPAIETKVRVSKDGKWLIHKTIFTDIRAVDRYEDLLGSKPLLEEDFIE